MADCFANNGPEHLAVVCTFHGVTGFGGGDEQVAGLDRTVLGADLSGHNAGHCHGHLFLHMCPNGELASADDARLCGVNARDPGGIWRRRLEEGVRR